MNRNIAIVLLSAAVAVLGAVCIHQYRQALKVPPPPVERKYATSPRVAPDSTKDWIAPTRVPAPVKRDAAPRREAPPAESAEPAADDAQGGMKPPAMLMAGIAQMLKNPAMKSMIRGQQKVALDMQYGQLFQCLDLPPQKMEALKEILLDRQMAFMDGGISMIAPGTSDEDRRVKAEDLARIKTEYDQKVTDLIGTENASLYTQYEETQPERMQVQMFKQGLSGADALTEQQEHELIRGMYEERQALGAESMGPGGMPQGGALDEVAMQKAAEQMARLDERYTQRAEAVLSPTQMEQFRKNRQQQRAMQQMGIKFATQIMVQKDK